MSETYEPAQRPPPLTADIVHVWRAPIEPLSSEFERCSATLSDDERARAARFHFERDRQKYIAARGALRRLLGKYLDQEPAAIVFHYGARGKPQINQTSPPGGSLEFNVSHRGAFALYAFVRQREVGIDIAQLRNVVEARTSARHHFTPAEARLLDRAKTEPAAQECFFRLWTRKEAVIKAVGTGLSMPLDEFDVSSEPQTGETWRTIHVPARPETLWTVRDLPVAEGYHAALCLAGGPAEIRYLRLA
ncbi:MAG: 4'-phosphopantetheinyl transferase superfamily protein [Singulisphaera sp.]